MRLQKILVPAFGPFTNFELTFPEKPLDLHIVYGANEAGKSSLLRAIRDLLFGIHVQSPDNFLHDYKNLRIKGQICNRTGEDLIFQRRKGTKNTLLDATGGQLPDSALAAFLGSVDQSYFSTMFGLGARELHEGAQQLLRGEGDMGHALFSASMGGTPVQKVLESLQEEAERIFKGRATANVSLRPAANRYKDLLKQSREAIVRPETWDKIEKELGNAEVEKKRLETEISKLDLELGWIVRCEDALPTVVTLAEEMEKLAQLPPLPDVATDFISRVRGARQDTGKTQVEVQRLTDQIENLQTQLENCKISPEVLAVADILDQLHQDLGVYRDRKKSLAGLREKLAGLEPVLRASMQNLQMTGEFSTLADRRLGSAVQLACEEAARTMQKALEEESTNVEKADSLQSQIAGMQEDLEALPETSLDSLREALTVAAEATDADKTIAASKADVQRRTREMADKHKLIAGAPDDFDATTQLTVPALATIRRYHEQMDGINRDIVAEKKEVRTSQARSDAIQGELIRLQRQGELPTEEALRKAREHRDHGWGLVLAEWKGSGTKEELAPDSPLEEAFPLAIKKADEIADTLREDADAVAQAEEKRLQVCEVEKQVAAANQRIEELQKSLAECQKAWESEWAACGIAPRSPSEMEEWRTQWVEFGESFKKLADSKETLETKTLQIQSAKKSLAAVLGESEEKEYSLLFAAVRKLVQDGEQAAGQRKEMLKRIEGLKNESAKFEKSRGRLNTAVTASTEKWKSQCEAVGLPEGTSPDAGLILLRERKDLLVKFDEWQESSSQSELTTGKITHYESSVSEKAATLRIKGETTEALESALWKALKDARELDMRHNQLSDQIEQNNADLKEAQRLETVAEQVLSELMRLAEVKTVEQLDPLLVNLEKRDAVQSQIAGLRKTLSGPARGQSVDEFVTKVRAENPDSLVERKSTAIRDKRENETALATISETVFNLTNERKILEKAGDAAADFLQQAESCAATLTQDSARFLRLRLAIHLLQCQIERFRKENQGPLLQKAGEVFSAITRSAFSGLGADFNADDVPILVGLRPDQTKVSVEGLSDGSRDQLYLALRLAALDRFLEEHEPMPLILDDLLITFDNDRAKAILPQLGGLARRTQVFLFTHHEHLVELCRETLGDGQFHLHRLSTGSSK
jgi:uncharacterized protein YhaN